MRDAVVRIANSACEMTATMALAESELQRICRQDVPADVQAVARLNLLDWLGCVLAARFTPVARAMARALAEDGGDVLHQALSPARSDAQKAALALGSLGNVLEMDDLHRASILHPGDTVCAAALAVALRRPTSGPALLTAIVRGYEMATRIGTAVAAGGYTPFYNSGTCGVFGAAMVAADLHRLDPEQTADALGQAGMQAAGIWQCRIEPTFSKQLATAHAARAGVFSAELGAAGFPGARAILTGEMGFLRSYYPGADPTALTAPAPWAVTAMSFKPFPACRHTHPAISAALALGNDVRDLGRVDIHTYRAALDFCDTPHPETPDQARFSLQHAVAVTLQKGPPEISDFDPPALRARQTRELRSRVRLHVDPEYDAAFPRQYGARVEVTSADGTTRSAACPAAWGDPENPMSAADLIAKFHRNAAHGGLSRASASDIETAVMALPDAADLTALARSLTQALAPDPETVRCR